ncbi:PREDICTED: E3 ubiquitin-protein ligase ATL42-like [Tarenaya hassleriana]|uniref:E3 ubiquitin-protein ligase ATL42-like n=1 Tax=Tarenaya hassleriana TaxID=28532 RepID=UPI00053C6CFE|nr:PREDICTED: E3 ubiquitin-protein ligase ATL42-like [Tarenaya hassleriana]
MNPTQAIFFFFFVVSSGYVSGQSPPAGDEHPYRTGELVANFEPSLAVVTGVLSIMFTLTFVLLLYAKCCYSDLRSDVGEGQTRQRIVNDSARFSGLDKTAIESLPFFRFSALKGSRHGLECSVCLSRFEDVEILRLLPKCRHAFHIGCIDQWLEQHASCPLCRNRIAIDDPSVFAYSNSLRFLNQTEVREDSSLELCIEREEKGEEFSIGGSFRKILKMGNKEKPISENEKQMHRFNHRIVVSDAVFQSRWSNVSSSDLMFLNSELINSMSSDRFSWMDRPQKDPMRTSTGASEVPEQEGISRIMEEMEMKRMVANTLSSMNTTFPNPLSEPGNTESGRTAGTGRRSVSEITVVPRRSVLQATGTKNNAIPENNSDSTAIASVSALAFASSSRNVTTEERRRRLWLPIARRTAQWFANREQRFQHHLDNIVGG